MQTKLGLFCDRVIEAGLVATVVTVPLFFSAYGRIAFSLTKTTLARSILLVMAVAWLVRAVEARPRPGTERKAEMESSGLTRFLRTPLALPILILAAAYVLSTAVSIWPRGSLWGSYLRAQGTYANLVYMAIFPLALTTLRRQEQVDRLVTAVLLTSLPVALYGIMQHYSLDPFRWVGLADAVAERAISTMANPLFMAGYLLTMVPLTLGRIVGSVKAVRQGRLAAASGYFLTACYFLLLIVQLLAFLFTQSRGALVGLGIGCLLFALLLATMRRHRAQILTFTLLGIQVSLFFIILNLPNTPLQPLRRLPYLSRLGQVFNMQSGSGRLRVLIWGGVLDLASSDPLRALVGYGPETLEAAVSPYLSEELVMMGASRGAMPDRSHNETLDALATTGLIGTAAYFLVITAVFYYGLKALGLMEGRRQQYAFITLWLGGGALTPLAFRAFEGTWRLAGVGVPIGMVAGLFVFILGHNFLSTREVPSIGTHRQIMIISLLAAVAAHFVEIQFGIAVTVTRILFWLYAALIIAVGYSEGQPVASTVKAPPSGRRRRRRRQLDRAGDAGESLAALAPAGPGRISFLYYALAMSLALLTLAFDFSAPGASAAGVRGNMVLYFAGVCIFAGILIHAETQALGGQEVGGDWSPLVYLGTSVVFAVLFIVGLRPFPTTLARGLGGLVIYHLWLLLALAILALWLLLAPGSSIPATFSRRPWWLYVPVLAVGLLLIAVTNVTPVRADMIYARALALQNTDDRIAFLEQALDTAPNEAQYTSLGKAYLTKARDAAIASEAFAWLERAHKAFERARELDPLLPERTANLGDLYRVWGELSLRSDDRIKRLDMAVSFYSRAGEMSPLQARLSSKDLSETYLLLGEAQAVAGQSEEASAAYEMAVKTASDSAWAYLAEGALHAQAGELEAAGEAIQQAADLAPDSYIVHWSLARIHQQMGDSANALDEADKARELAPQSLRAHLETVLGP